MDDKTMKISKKCPKCGRRLFDKISPASGYIEIKCNKCGASTAVGRSCGSKYTIQGV